MIEILLATYNGEKFLQAQLDSIFHQTFQDWCIVAHDDGSTDATLEILQQFKLEHPAKMKILDDGVSFGSARDNFEHLMKHAAADYIMLCDQDDVWMDDKIVQTLSAMKKVEYQNPHKPVLVHTDLIVVDEALNVIAPSMFAYQRLKKNSTLKNLMVRNNVTGCTLMLNQQALACSLPIPKQAMMHDWWLVLKVKQDGVVVCVNQPTIYYRQHGRNCLGAVKVDFQCLLKQYFFGARVEGLPTFKDVIKQAKMLDRHLTLPLLYLYKYIMLAQVLLYLPRFRRGRDLPAEKLVYDSSEKVVVLLSAYQGCNYIEKQIQSIQEQSHQNWELLIRDDGSSDATYLLLKELEATDERIHLMAPSTNVGVIHSFSVLSKEGGRCFPQARYFMFADQDDIWLPLKIEKTLACMQSLEDRYEYALVHTDLEVVDDGLQTIAPSFFKFQHIQHPKGLALNKLLTQNFVTGCTVMVNRNLLQVVLPIPNTVMMHDWWLALCAASLGNIGVVDQPTMLYRQHKENSVGAKGFWGVLKGMIASPKLFLMRRERFAKVQQQTQALWLFLQDKGVRQGVVESFVQLPYLSCFQRLKCVREAHIQPQFWVRKIAFWWDLFRLPKQDKS